MTEQADATKKRLADEREARQKQQAEQHEAMAKGKPTPTQEENDLAASGVPVTEHEDDGSGPDPHVTAHETRNLEARRPAGGAGYQTRHTEPARREPQQRPHTPQS